MTAFAIRAEDRALHLKVTDDGAEIVKAALPTQLLDTLETVFPQTRSNVRSGFDIPAIRELSCHPEIRRLVTPVLGERCFAVRAVLFNKTAQSNWKVAWHQDSVIAVQAHIETEGWGPWSVKLGVPHVRPSASILEQMLTVRLHLDDCGEENGALRVLPGSHAAGLLSDTAISKVSKSGQVICCVKRGDVILMRPLLLHASSAATASSSRRVVHLEFASTLLPAPLSWHEAIGIN